MPELIVCSHRGPVVYEAKGDDLVARRGGGGLIGAVAPVIERLGGTWIAAAMSEGDRIVAGRSPQGAEADGFSLRLLDLPRDLHDLHYHTVSNNHLWYLFHYLFDVANAPAYGHDFLRAWGAYRQINEIYAEAVLDSGRADAVMVHDYHLMLVGRMLRQASRARRPLMYFHHTPWCEPDYFGMLPDAVASDIVRGMLAYDVVGFHARRWADAFARCCERFGATVSGDTVAWRRHSTRMVVAPVPLDVHRLEQECKAPETQGWVERHDETAAGRTVVLRVDRIDLSKNPLRGFLAFEQLLDVNPRLAHDVVFLALLYPSRLTVERYRRYFADCLGVVRRINERFTDELGPAEGPIILDFQDDYLRSVAAMRVYDTLLVNPIYDGLNLVSKEGAYANERDGSLILSHNAGAFEELGRAAIEVNPFDVNATAEAMHEAIEMPAKDRATRARRLRRLATATTPQEWASAQLSAAGLSASS